MNPDSLVNLVDFEHLAQERLAPLARDYYASGANDEITLAGNRRAFDHMALWYRVLVDVAERNTRRRTRPAPCSTVTAGSSRRRSTCR